jgi:hypothetical protein
MIIKTKKAKDPFARILNVVVCDKRLSYRARGVLCYLLSKPRDWEVVAEDVIDNGTEGRDALRTCFQELKKFGYARLVPNPAGGSQWIICEDPVDRETGKPHLGNGTRPPEKADALKIPPNKDGKKKSTKKEGRRRGTLTDEEFWEALRINPAYQGIDFVRERGKMAAWLLTPAGRGRQLTHRFILNWLNKCDRPVKIPGPTRVEARDVALPSEFRKWAVEAYASKADDIGKMKTWADVPNWMRDEWRRKKVAPVLSMVPDDER